MLIFNKKKKKEKKKKKRKKKIKYINKKIILNK